MIVKLLCDILWACLAVTHIIAHWGNMLLKQGQVMISFCKLTILSITHCERYCLKYIKLLAIMCVPTFDLEFFSSRFAQHLLILLRHCLVMSARLIPVDRRGTTALQQASQTSGVWQPFTCLGWLIKCAANMPWQNVEFRIKYYWQKMTLWIYIINNIETI
jgi:hypothetical protein